MRHAPAPYSERLVLDPSSVKQEFAFIKSQEVAHIIRAAKDARDYFKKDTGPVQGRFLGTVPLVLAQKWAQECGAAVGSREWAKYVKKKLKSNEWSGLRVHG